MQAERARQRHRIVRVRASQPGLVQARIGRSAKALHLACRLPQPLGQAVGHENPAFQPRRDLRAGTGQREHLVLGLQHLADKGLKGGALGLALAPHCRPRGDERCAQRLKTRAPRLFPLTRPQAPEGLDHPGGGLFGETEGPGQLCLCRARPRAQIVNVARGPRKRLRLRLKGNLLQQRLHRDAKAAPVRMNGTVRGHKTLQNYRSELGFLRGRNSPVAMLSGRSNACLPRKLICLCPRGDILAMSLGLTFQPSVSSWSSTRCM